MWWLRLCLGVLGASWQNFFENLQIFPLDFSTPIFWPKNEAAQIFLQELQLSAIFRSLFVKKSPKSAQNRPFSKNPIFELTLVVQKT